MADPVVASRHPEAIHRDQMWDGLIEAGGPADVAPSLLRDLGIYGGAQGIWIDAARTGEMAPDRAGITVGLLHTGRHYADDLATDSLLYHYPVTRRAGRDAYEVAATKNAAALRIPVFIITTGSTPRLRTVIRGAVAGWDDDLQIFRVRFLDAYLHSPGEEQRGPMGVPKRPPREPKAGTQYRRADEEAAATPRDPFTIDPDKIDRGLKSHARTQNALADWLRSLGLDPQSPGGLANFDIYWEDGQRSYVGEVKSLTLANESQQIRLGIGQVLDYAHLLSSERGRVTPVLVLEREPVSDRWADLCEKHGILLVWPDTFETLAKRH